ncbi:MAG: tetratricopeptide repeat protein [Acidobacteriota bacterium]|nr:tetratricopeptide repeat protein [Acidobacteriota bacterium]
MRFPVWVNCVVAACGLFAAGLPARAADTVAVLPLFNIDEKASPNLDWIGESVAETISEALGSSGLLVLQREDREEVYHRLSLRTGVILTKASVLKIGEALDAGQIAFGEFRVDGADTAASTLKSNTRLTVHIIDLKKLQQKAEFVENGPLETLSQMETKLAWMLLRQIIPDNAPSEDAFFHDRPPVRVDAMESYVRGLMAQTEDRKLKLFTQATRLDDRFSQPNFQLGRIMFAKKDYKAAGPWFSRVSKGDSHFLEAAFLKGICRYYLGDFDGAIDQLRMVSDEIPLNEVYNDLGAALSRRNDLSATDHFRKALDGDESDPDYWFNLGYSLWKQSHFTEAAQKFRAVLDRSPSDQEATIMLGRCLKSEGPRAGDPRSEGRERIKIAFEDSAWRQLQAELKSKHQER